MTQTATKLHQMIELANEFDIFGKLEKDMSLFSVAIGTLRKDKSLVTDIIKISEGDSDGLGAIALSRILTEDYLHLLFLNADPDKLVENIENFNLHPHIENYSSLQAMKEWGFDFSKEDDVDRIISEASVAFEANKARFLRRKAKETFNADDYYRTWTKLSLNDLIKNTGLTDTDEGRQSLKFMTETYDNASTIVHHNSLAIWLLANQGDKIFSDEYPELALTVSRIVFSQIIKLTLEIAEPEIGEEKLAEYMTRLADIL